jgi:biopolymer transport protein ExbB
MLSYLPLPSELISLIQSGGSVLWSIIFITFVLWILIIERCIYLWFTLPKELKKQTQKIADKSKENDWLQSVKNRAEFSEKSQRIFNNLPIIGALISIFPLLGLLGTVTGMIHLFDILAYIGNTNARAIASGVSMAVIPTLAGMFLAIVGIGLRAILLHRAKQQVFLLELQLR